MKLCESQNHVKFGNLKSKKTVATDEKHKINCMGVDEKLKKIKFSTDQCQNLISSGHPPGAYLLQIAKHLDQRFVSYRSTTENEVMTSGDLDLDLRSNMHAQN